MPRKAAPAASPAPVVASPVAAPAVKRPGKPAVAVAVATNGAPKAAPAVKAAPPSVTTAVPSKGAATAVAAPKRPGAPVAPVAVKAAPPAAADQSATIRALADELGAAKAELAKLQAAVSAAKAKPVNVRSTQEIVEGIKIAKNDWRLPYHGYETDIAVVGYMRRGKETSLQISETDTMHVLLAMPRDNDVGGDGAIARSQGRIAVHFVQDEAGLWDGQPIYMLEADLGRAWRES